MFTSLNRDSQSARIRQLFTVLVFCALIISSILVIPSAGQEVSEKYWQDEPKILEKYPPQAWWLKGVEKTSPTRYHETPVYFLRKMLSENAALQEKYVSHYVNPYNSTLYISLTEDDKELQSEILESIYPPKELTIKFVIGYAPAIKLEQWIQKMSPYKFKDNGIPCTAISTGANGTILLEFTDLDNVYIEKTLNLFKDDVPKGVLVFTKVGKDELNAIDHYQRPLMAGVQCIGRLNETHGMISTISWLVTEDGETQEYAIVSGHSIVDGYEVWQPTASANYYIGDADDIDATRYADCALVPLEPGVTAVSQIYSPINVVGQQDRDDQSLGDPIEMMGSQSGHETGEITGFISWKEHEKYGYIFDQVKGDYTAIDGDSGAPIYHDWREDMGVYNTYAWGLHVATTYLGETPLYRWYSPPDGVEADYNIDVDFSGA